ncbi:Kinesin light chain 3 [Blyttiomyces sp. JEL0837]|nr:Kinesin light chain 3 [Blyttiomyces sp. JEL0837]
MIGNNNFDIHLLPTLATIGLPGEQEDINNGEDRWVITSNKESLNIPTWGINLGYLLKLVEACGGRQAIASLTTANVCKLLVKPLTTDHEGSICDVLIDQGRYDAVQPANWFVSHAWEYDFMDMIDALASFFDDRDTDPNKVFLWIDLFCLSQHQQEVKSFEWLERTFMTAVKMIKNVLMVLQPWDDPISLKRAWCILEVLACERGNGSFHVALSPKENQRMLSDVLDEFSYEGMLSRVNSEKSNSTNSDDRDRIFETINDLTSFSALDRLVLKTYNTALISRAELYIEKALRESQSAIDVVNSRLVLIRLKISLFEHKDIRILCQTTWELCEKELPTNHPTAIMALLSLGSATAREGKYSEGEQLLTDCLKRCEYSLGDYHMLTMKTLNLLGQIYRASSLYELAETFTINALDRAKHIFGHEHKITVMFNIALGDLYVEEGKHNEAEVLMLETLDISSRIQGDDHPKTLRLAVTLGQLYLGMGKFEDCEQVLNDLLSRLRRVYGQYHTESVPTLVALGSLYDKMGQYQKAEAFKIESLEVAKEVFGPDHPTTLVAMNNLASLYTKCGKLDECEPLLLECIQRRERVLGRNHSHLLSSIRKLGNLYLQQAKHVQAHEINLDGWARCKEHFGLDFPETLKAQTSVAETFGMVGNCDEAENMFKDCIERMSRVLGEDNMETLATMQKYGEMLNRKGDYEQSVIVLSGCLESMKKQLGEDHPNTVTCAAWLTSSMERRIGA